MSDPVLAERLRVVLVSAPPEYIAVYLFGSQARGTAGPQSDVDLAFWRRTPSGNSLAEQPFDYAAELSRAVGKEVDLVELNRAPSDLVHRVLRDGIVLLDRDRAARIRFEVHARREYLDLAQVRKMYRSSRQSA